MPLADALCSLCNSNSESYDQMHHMEHLIKQYSRSVPYTPGPHRTRPPTSSVLLTGSTGNVGSDFLALLLSDPNVTRIYALNRHSPDGPAPMRVAAQFRTKGLDVSALNSKKLVFIEGDTAKHELGLESNLYSEILSSITMIIHNAWPINLHQGLTFYEPHLQGLRNLVDLGHASSASSALRFVFSSSYFGFQSWHLKYGSELLPEEVITDTEVGCGVGYGASKHVAERILSQSGLDATSLRFAQLSGRVYDGHWPMSEWLPLLLNASIIMGCIPTLHGLISFIPLDVGVKCAYEMVSSKQPLPAALNLAHPRPFRWNTFIQAVNHVLAEKIVNFKPLSVISFPEWIVVLEQSVILRKLKHPFLKLTGDSLRALAFSNKDIEESGSPQIGLFPRPGLSLTLAQQHSTSLRDLEELSSDDMQKWVAYWMSLKSFQKLLVEIDTLRPML